MALRSLREASRLEHRSLSPPPSLSPRPGQWWSSASSASASWLIVVGIRPLSQPDQIDIANTETAFGRSFCLRSTLPHCGKRKPKRDRWNVWVYVDSSKGVGDAWWVRVPCPRLSIGVGYFRVKYCIPAQTKFFWRYVWGGLLRDLPLSCWRLLVCLFPLRYSPPRRPLAGWTESLRVGRWIVCRTDITPPSAKRPNRKNPSE